MDIIIGMQPESRIRKGFRKNGRPWIRKAEGPNAQEDQETALVVESAYPNSTSHAVPAVQSGAL